jgi:glutaredoxin
MILRAFLLVLLGLTAAGLAQAQQFRWVDQNGKVQFGNVAPPGAKDVRRMNAATAKPGTAAKPDAAALPFELGELKKNFPVTLYTAPICKDPCERARGVLNKRGVPFSEMQVSNAESLEQLKKATGGENVPALVVGRSVQSGFDQNRYEALLDSAGYPAAGVFPARAQAAPPLPEGYEPPPVAEPVAPAAGLEQKPGPYDPSGLTGPAPKPGQYDPSGLTGPPPKPGQYGVPGESK